VPSAVADTPPDQPLRGRSAQLAQKSAVGSDDTRQRRRRPNHWTLSEAAAGRDSSAMQQSGDTLSRRRRKWSAHGRDLMEWQPVAVSLRQILSGRDE